MSERMTRDLSDDVRTDVRPDALREEPSQRDIADQGRGGADLHTADLVASPGDRNGTGDRAERSEDTASPLLGETESYRRRWEAVQTGFVDEPRRAVEKADALVAEIMQELAKSFAEERNGLESQWSQGDQVSTEDLRVSLQRYRSFFDRLLTT